MRCKRKNFIQKIHTATETVYDHKGKEELIHRHFSNLFGTPAQRRFTLDWEAIGLHPLDLRALEEDFTEEEVQVVIHDLAVDKAPGPMALWGRSSKQVGR